MKTATSARELSKQRVRRVTRSFDLHDCDALVDLLISHVNSNSPRSTSRNSVLLSSQLGGKRTASGPTAMSPYGTERTYRSKPVMSASLIGRLGSSAYRLSTSTVSMSLTGSCFSSESALRPFHHGIRRRGETIFGTALPSV